MPGGKYAKIAEESGYDEKLLRRVVELRDRKGLGFPEVARTLNAEGFRTPTGKEWANQVWSLYKVAKGEKQRRTRAKRAAVAAANGPAGPRQEDESASPIAGAVVVRDGQDLSGPAQPDEKPARKRGREKAAV